MTQKATALLLLIALTLAAAPRAARGAAASDGDKSQYHLFNPTPRALMRDLSTDRPDVTESPYTVDAGHFQIEMSLVEYVRDDAGGERLVEYAVAPTNLKIGLLNNLDLQLVFEPYVHQRLRNGGRQTFDGFGSTQLRLKMNIWGNDGGDTALGVMPWVQFQTADRDLRATTNIEGGIIVPLSIALPQEWTLAVQAEIDFLRDDVDEGYGAAYLHTISISRPITGELGGYLEYVGVAHDDLGAGYMSLIGGGFTYGLGPDVQLDGAIYFGISDSAPDFWTLIGISFRI